MLSLGFPKLSEEDMDKWVNTQGTPKFFQFQVSGLGQNPLFHRCVAIQPVQPKLKSSNDMFMAQLLLCTGMQEKSQPSMQTNQISGEEKEKKPLQHHRAGRYECVDPVNNLKS